MFRSLTTVDGNRDGCRGARGVGPALLGERRRPQPDPGRAGDVAEAVAGVETALVVGAGDEDGTPAAGLRLEVLDRDELAAAGDRRAASAHAATQVDGLPGPQ